MIVRRAGDYLLLITQPDHAHLSGRIMTAWEADDLQTRGSLESVLLATCEHDNGWDVVDGVPAVDPRTGQPYAFMNAPDSVKRGIWPRAVARLEPRDPAAAALVAQHGITVLERQPTPEWSNFFAAMEAERDRLVASGAYRGQLSRLREDYRMVFLGDLLSLIFCCGWTEVFSREGYTVALAGDALEIDPDPFAGRPLALEVPARRIPAVRYGSDEALRHALERAPTTVLRGTARGPRQ